MFRSFMHWCKGEVRSCRSSRQRFEFRPRLEILEDRCLPSTLTVTRSDDGLAEKGTLRYAIAHAASGDTIRLGADLSNKPIMLTSGELLLDKDLIIKGLGRTP